MTGRIKIDRGLSSSKAVVTDESMLERRSSLLLKSCTTGLPLRLKAFFMFGSFPRKAAGDEGVELDVKLEKGGGISISNGTILAELCEHLVSQHLTGDDTSVAEPSDWRDELRLQLEDPEDSFVEWLSLRED